MRYSRKLVKEEMDNFEKHPFEVADFNKTAYKVVENWSQKAKENYIQPLLLLGSTANGKTYLAHQHFYNILQENPEKLIYWTPDEFYFSKKSRLEKWPRKSILLYEYSKFLPELIEVCEYCKNNEISLLITSCDLIAEFDCDHVVEILKPNRSFYEFLWQKEFQSDCSENFKYPNEEIRSVRHIVGEMKKVRMFQELESEKK